MKQTLLDIGERIVWTFVLTYATLSLATGVQDLSQQKVAATAGIAAAGAVAWNALAKIIGVQNGKTWWQDALFRALTTFIQAAGALIIVNGSLDWTQWKPAALAGLTAVVTFLKGVALSRVGDQNTAGIFAVSTLDQTAYVPQHAADHPAPADPAPAPVVEPAAEPAPPAAP